MTVKSVKMEAIFLTPMPNYIMYNKLDQLNEASKGSF